MNRPQRVVGIEHMRAEVKIKDCGIDTVHMQRNFSGQALAGFSQKPHMPGRRMLQVAEHFTACQQQDQCGEHPRRARNPQSCGAQHPYPCRQKEQRIVVLLAHSECQ